jgi:cytochrome c peroxidase
MVGGRYSAEQLYALALYVYSLTPPPNPKKMNDAAKRGQKIFEAKGCGTCHTTPLYTNNKLTPAEGLLLPLEQRRNTRSCLSLSERIQDLPPRPGAERATIRVPSLKGIWYRSMFGHSGWCATLEDWFDLIGACSATILKRASNLTEMGLIR